MSATYRRILDTFHEPKGEQVFLDLPNASQAPKQCLEPLWLYRVKRIDNEILLELEAVSISLLDKFQHKQRSDPGKW